jgi:succinate dehydrogenase/fumarate reductase cytochrome b subunit
MMAPMSPPDPAPESRAWAERIFRITGFLPLAVFALLHVGAYAAAPSGDHGFALGWLGLCLEVALVLAPLVYHSGYGLFLLLRGERGDPSTLVRIQRWTSPLLLLFLVDHVVRLRAPLLAGLLAPEDTHALLVRELSSTWGGVPAVAAFQCLGTAVLAFHLGFGLYRSEFVPLRGLAAPRSRAWLGASVGLFVLLFGSFAIIGLATGKSFPFV